MSVDLEQFASQLQAAAVNQHEVAKEPRTTNTFARIVAKISYRAARLAQEGSNCCLSERKEGDKSNRKKKKKRRRVW